MTSTSTRGERAAGVDSGAGPAGGPAPRDRADRPREPTVGAAARPAPVTKRLGLPGRLEGAGANGRRDRRPARARPGIRRTVATAAAVLAFGSSRVLACPMCFGAEETSMIGGTKLGVLVMLGITLVVQGAFAGFFLYLRRRAQHIAEVELDTEWSELQRASRSS
jgi:hypothetical protein